MLRPRLSDVLEERSYNGGKRLGFPRSDHVMCGWVGWLVINDQLGRIKVSGLGLDICSG